MKRTPKPTRQTGRTAQKRRQERQGYIACAFLVLLAITSLLEAYALPDRLFVSGTLYYYLFFALPALGGFTATFLWLRTDFITDWQAVRKGKTFFLKPILIFLFSTLFGAAAGFIFIGLPLATGFKFANHAYAQGRPLQYEQARIKSFWTKKIKSKTRGYITFYHEGQTQFVNVDPARADSLSRKNPDHYRLRIAYRPGWLQTFFVEDWEIETLDDAATGP